MFALTQAVVISAISIVQSLFKVIEHVHLSRSRVTFQEVNTRPICVFVTPFPSLHIIYSCFGELMLKGLSMLIEHIVNGTVQR